MQQISQTNDAPIKQFTKVFHIELGEGSVVSVTFRKDNNLIMCYFPKGRTHEWITEQELRRGVGDITLTRQATQSQSDNIPDSLEDALRSLFSPR